MPLSGVKYSLNYDHPNGTQPMRVSYFMNFGKYGSGSDVNNVGSYFALHPQENQVEAVFPPGPMEDVSAPSSVAKSGGEVLIGLAIVNGHLHHAANYDTLPGVAMGSKDSLAMEFMEHDRWYKIDIIRFNQTYTVRWMTIFASLMLHFDGVELESAYNYHQVTTWLMKFCWTDFTANFRCPIWMAIEKRKWAKVYL